MHPKKSLTRIAAAGALVLALALPAMAVTVAVTNYNWLNLAPADVTAFIGSTTGVGGSGSGTPIDFRWGTWAWIPNRALTGNGSGSYWAAVKLDGPRLINNVIPQWWTGDGVTLSKAYVDGSNDGVNWTQMGYNNFGSTPGTRARTTSWTSFTPGTYQYVRIRLANGDYTSATTGYDYGGPGVLTLEPVGNGTVFDSQANWLNQPNFGTTVSNSNLTFNHVRYNDGYLYDDEGARTGDQGTWAANQYMQMNLGTPRVVYQIAGVWDYGWKGTSYDVSYSTDGTTFTLVTGKSAPINYGSGGLGAMGYTFDPVTAQYWRISGATGGGPWELFNQVLIWAPEPTSLMLLGLGGLALLRRPRAA